MANTIEEILEFVASVIFLFACILAFLNARQNARLTSAIEESISRWRGRMLLYPLAAAAAALLVVAVAVVLLSPPRGLGFKGTRDLAVEAFTGDESARLHPDGLTSSHGRLYVANDAPPSIAVLDRRSGHSTVIDAIPPAGTPESVAVASDGRIYFSDDSGGSIYVVYGRQVRRLLGRESGLRAPKGLLIGPGDELYIADTGASAIFKYSGGKLTFYASSLDGIAAPHELAFDSHGNLYVTEDQRRILKVRPDGRASVFLGESPGFTPEAIAIRDDRIYVTDSSAGAVLEYGLDGVGRALIVFPATLGRKLEGVAVTGNGDLWVGVRPDKGIPGAILRIHKRAS